MVATCKFDKLFSIRVLHIHEKIFLSLDYESYKKCLKVSKSWNDLLTSESFLRRSKSAFCEDIQEELLQATARGHVDTIQRVLTNFMVNINFLTKRKESALITAAENNHNDVVQLLLDRGADPNMADQDGFTPLFFAVQDGFIDVVQTLLDRGAEPNMVNHDGHTPIEWAATDGHEDVVRLLLDRRD